MDVRLVATNAVTLICGTPPDAIVDDAALSELGVGSLDLVEIAMIVEDAFGVRIEPGEFEGVSTFGGAMAILERIVSGGSA